MASTRPRYKTPFSIQIYSDQREWLDENVGNKSMFLRDLLNAAMYGWGLDKETLDKMITRSYDNNLKYKN